MATTLLNTLTMDPNDFPARRTSAPPMATPAPPDRRRGVRLELSEEARRERDADWAEYDRWSAAMSRWVDRGEPGPQPY